ncbi:uncharacterized protein LOC135848033 [Planococcus citri]|uniref:uncharacterized protein LOC135848033 n=1 Tax=Planococcus citri TaxID=170843 RepID=UPI0031F7FEFB
MVNVVPGSQGMPICRIMLQCIVFVMEKWTSPQRAFIVKAFYKNNDSYVKAIRAFRKQFNFHGKSAVPTRPTVKLWVKNFEETSQAGKKKPTGRKRSVRTAETVERVRHSVQISPTQSYRKRAAHLGIKRSSMQQILSKDLNFHPYKILITQKLEETDYDARKSFAADMLERIDSGEVPLKSLLVTDEAHFYINGDVNKQNMQYWSDNNPMSVQEKPLHSAKLTVWMGVAEYGLVGPYVFDGTVNGDRYRAMLSEFLIPELKRKRKYSATWFQQDGATCHSADKTITLLREHFHDRIISRNTKIPWPPRSPDLSACDYFLWGYLKSKVYVNKPQTLTDLQNNIIHECALISQGMLAKVFNNFRKRLEECVENDGKHLNCVIFKK